mgnify:CR=1 FL=1
MMRQQLHWKWHSIMHQRSKQQVCARLASVQPPTQPCSIPDLHLLEHMTCIVHVSVVMPRQSVDPCILTGYVVLPMCR